MKRNLAFALGLLLVLPALVALRVLPWRHKYEVSTKTASEIVTASAGRAAVMAGMEWRLKSITEGVPQQGARPIPPRTKVAVAVYSVKPVTAQAVKWFDDPKAGLACPAVAVDGLGRRWKATIRRDLVPEDGQHAYGCVIVKDRDENVPLPLNQERTIRAVFVVPQDALRSLGLEVRVSTWEQGLVRLNR
ncbi:hypothetical protein HNP84_000474 [Thermocatellispora tengchongensis]|uniref:DUF4352 domain-containing protein n=1 Tax=Thermocatellispora tengchongensis TaxID=1073253 RepID=A0A840NX57_9ACTN|nr:hypothetical protein [Thermocatellispora tengchongensis]MBB5130786.1 hypothetical protein [Thermocatellispora tengchongensis]